MNLRNPKAKKADQKVANSATRRTELAEKRAKEQQAMKRKKLVAWIIATAVLICAAVAIGIGIWNSLRPNDVFPARVTADHSGISIYAKKAQADAPEVRLFNDFQCSNCKNFSQTVAPELVKLADKGEIKLSFHTMQFLDTSIEGENSHRSNMAAICADDVGLYHQYVSAVYELTPDEGENITDELLVTIATEKAGITGDKLEVFKKCYDSKKYSRFVDDANKVNEKWLTDNGLKVSTPTLTSGNKAVDLTKLEKVTDLLDAIKNTK